MSGKFILAMISLWFGLAVVEAQTTTNDDGSLLFKFKFDPKRPLTYAIEYKVSQMSDNEVGQRSSLTRSTTETRYNIKLTPAATNQDGTISIWYEPFDYEQDGHSTGPSGQIDSTVRGLAMRIRQNGIVTVD